jgi:hypothetical protein
MTQSVSFHFISSQFVIESGIVAFTKGARLFSEDEFRTGHIKDGAVDGVLVEGPIEFDAMLADLAVVRIDDGRRYNVGFLKVTGELRPQDLRAGRIPVRLNRKVILIVRVEDPEGHPVPNARVSLVLPNWEPTAEGVTNAAGEIVLLAGPGRYSATLSAVQNRRLRPSVSADVEITPADAEEHIIVLRIPKR